MVAEDGSDPDGIADAGAAAIGWLGGDPAAGCLASANTVGILRVRQGVRPGQQTGWRRGTCWPPPQLPLV
eukprot:1149076-Pelagomonas_calceolata.AAC.2